MSLVDNYPKVSATEAGAHLSRVLDQAQRGPVAIVRRGVPFVLLRAEDYERQLTEHVQSAYPRFTLDQLLAGYDREQHRAPWPDDAPAGKESL